MPQKVKKEEEEFKRDDCNERDFKDTGARKKKKKVEEEQRKKIISTEFLPSSMKKLRACVTCRLVLNR